MQVRAADLKMCDFYFFELAAQWIFQVVTSRKAVSWREHLICLNNKKPFVDIRGFSELKLAPGRIDWPGNPWLIVWSGIRVV